MMQKLTRNIVNNKLYKFRYIFTFEFSEQPSLRIQKITCKYKTNKNNNRNMLSKKQMIMFLKTQMPCIIVNDALMPCFKSN